MPQKNDSVGAFVFDLDGTLVDSGRDIARSANFVRTCFGLPELTLATAKSYVGDGVSRLLVRVLGHDAEQGRTGDNGLAVNEDRLAAGLDIFAEHYGQHLLDQTQMYPGTREVLALLAGYPLQVATNKPREFADRILEALELRDLFRRVVGGDDIVARKPDPAHLALALDGLNVPPHQVVVVGDSPNDVHAARSYGAIAVGCTYGLVAPSVVAAAEPDHLIDSITALPGLFAL